MIALVSKRTLSIFLLLTVPSKLKFFVEKNQGKIRTLSLQEQNNINTLFNMLWYDKISNSILNISHNDVDIWHSQWSLENIEALMRKLHVVLKSENNSIIHIHVPWSWSEIQKHYCGLDISIQKDQIIAISDSLQISTEECCYTLSALMNLAMGEYIEQQQSESIINNRIAWSGHNNTDYNGNLLWVTSFPWFQNNNNKSLEKNINILQRKYDVWNASFLLQELAKEFWLQTKIIEQTP